MKGSLIIGVFSFLLLYGFTVNEQDPAGKKVFVDSKCGTCHSVEAAGLTSKSKKSTDLSDTGKKYDQEALTKILTKKEKLNGKLHAAAFKGTDEDLAELTAWMASLKGTK